MTSECIVDNIICCRYFYDSFTLLPKLTRYLEEDTDARLTKQAALKAKHMERSRLMKEYTSKQDF